MENIDIAKLKHKPEILKKHFTVKGDVTYCNTNLRVVFPERYLSIGLASLGDIVNVVNIFAVIDENDNYAVVIAPIINKLQPFNITEAMCNNELNIVLEFEKDTVFMGSNTLIKDDFLNLEDLLYSFHLQSQAFDKISISWL